jgi:protein CpxP
MTNLKLERRRDRESASGWHKAAVTITIATVLLSIVWVVAAAKNPDGGHRGYRGGNLTNDMRGMLSHLDLTDEQREEVRSLMHDSRDQAEQAGTQMDGLKTEVMDLVRTNGFDEPQIRILLETKSPQIIDLMLLRIKAMAEIYAVLTPEQQAEAEAFLEDGRGRKHRHSFQSPP